MKIRTVPVDWLTTTAIAFVALLMAAAAQCLEPRPFERVNRFMLASAMNPCPCGYFGDPAHDCKCRPALIHRYRSRISGPLLDRIDIHLEVPAVKFHELANDERAEPST